ncbi:heterokaryon incompatibility [Fusarium albosuccineum]|uniref:Heterokaryon incompatibility n=1 Tax=Fusarium albosuccineum TaxID=1237068 RepID=A0A8H4PAB6_9HYPO|nr:heterokaryon incompatibility [Fusarium albosuccineum]
MPEHVNFYTPENSAFYSRFRYSDLDPDSECIRLLRIKPPKTPDLIKMEEIKCDLLDNISLGSIRGKYTTLSYCAGSPHDIETVVINGIPFNAFANLGHALRQARHFWIEGGDQDELLLWADQICINQNNPLERTHQVKLMADIYTASEQVLVSLSTEHDPEGGLEWLQGAVPVMKRWREHHRRAPSLKPDPRGFHGVGLNAFLETILSSSWWARAWIRQEFICSPNAHFMATFESIHWEALEEFMSVYWANFNTFNTNETCPYELNQKGQASSPCLACLFRDDGTTRQEGFRAFKLLSAKRNWVPFPELERDLRSQLLETYLCKASDPRDLMYAFLGISDRCYGIFPDYSPHISFQEICTQLAHNIICHDTNLDLLHWAYVTHRASQDPDWPSWVPDWRTKITALGFMSKRDRARHSTGISFSKDDKDNQKRILDVRGVLCTKLRSDPVLDNVSNFDSKVLSVTSENMMVRGRGKKDDEVWALDGTCFLYILRRRGQYHQLVGEVVCWKPIPEHYPLRFEDYDMPGLEGRENAAHTGLETVRISYGDDEWSLSGENAMGALEEECLADKNNSDGSSGTGCGTYIVEVSGQGEGHTETNSVAGPAGFRGPITTPSRARIDGCETTVDHQDIPESLGKDDMGCGDIMTKTFKDYKLTPGNIGEVRLERLHCWSETYDTLDEAASIGDVERLRQTIAAEKPPIPEHIIQRLLSAAIWKNQISVVEFLLAEHRPSKIEEEPYRAAVYAGSMPIVSALVAVDPSIINMYFDRRGSALLVACQSRQRPEFLRFLLELGEDPNADPDCTFLRALGWAAGLYQRSWPGLEVVQLLVSYGAKLEHTSALEYAARENHEDIMRYLLDLGADHDRDTHELFMNSEGRDLPIHTAARRGNTGIVKMLLEHGVDVECKNGRGQTAAQVAEQVQREQGTNLQLSDVTALLEHWTRDE